MSENDYIAEYIKQKHPQILGMDFTLWKTMEVFKNFAKKLGKILQVTPSIDVDFHVEEEDPEDTEAAGDEEDEDLEA